MDTPTAGREIHITGRVQGVGYRPWVYQLAQQIGVCGSVRNDCQGVRVQAWGDPEQLNLLVRQIEAEGPPMARVEAVHWQPLTAEQAPPGGFSILPSHDGGAGLRITPDIATCPACLGEAGTVGNRRYRYPFTSCSHCGPRLSIQTALPWDRARTTMQDFPLCADCRSEYEDPADRRYHAQPLVCPSCGPELWFQPAGSEATRRGEQALQDAIALLQGGGILAIKGTGGWQLACDATRPDVVVTLRQRKCRPAKPLALMARDCEAIAPYALLSAAEKQALTNPEAPITLLRSLQETLPDAIAPGLHRVGFMLPHSVLHQLLLAPFTTPLVLTSGNHAGEPQLTDDSRALLKLTGIADGFLGHNRPIAHRVDDSVVRCDRHGIRTLRAGRGLAPATFSVPGAGTHPPLLAMGAHLKNTFAIAQRGEICLSQHIGDLDTPQAREEAADAAELYLALLGQRPELVVTDLHPDYATTLRGQALAGQLQVPLQAVQHHHAHLAAGLLEHGVGIDEAPVLGVILDGLGYGPDGELWGGEFLLGDYRGCQRLGTFRPVALPGGNSALREPWRNLLAHLCAELGWEYLQMNFAHLELMHFLQTPARAPLRGLLSDRTLAPLASSCGRLFDAVAAALGICREALAYEGQAAMELEAIVDPQALQAEGEEAAYPFSIPRLNGAGLPYLEPLAMWQALLGDLHLQTPPGIIAARFHRGLAAGIVRMVTRLRGQADEARFTRVVLSGGVFQNQVLSELVEQQLEDLDFKVLPAQRIPAGDGGIAAGQAAIALAEYS